MPARKLTYRPTSVVAAPPAAHHSLTSVDPMMKMEIQTGNILIMKV